MDQGIKISLSGSENKLNLTISLNIKNNVPGFYLFNFSILDYLGQPYLDANVVFKTEGPDWHKDVDARYNYKSNEFNESQDPTWNFLHSTTELIDKRVEMFEEILKSYGVNTTSSYFENLCKFRLYKGNSKRPNCS